MLLRRQPADPNLRDRYPCKPRKFEGSLLPFGKNLVKIGGRRSIELTFIAKQFLSFVESNFISASLVLF